MDDLSPRPPAPGTGGCSAAARAVAARCEPRVNELARLITRDTFAGLPHYRSLPADMRDIEIAATVRYGLRLFLRRVRDETAAEEDSYRYFRERAAQRAEEGLPLHVLLRTHLMARRILWSALREVALPGEQDALLELADILVTAQEALIGDVAESYLDEQAALAAEQREERRSLLRALLAGEEVPAARVEDMGAADGGLVLALRLDDGDAQARPAPGTALTAVADRRQLRRLHAALERALSQDVLVLVEGDHCHAIVPRRRGEPRTAQPAGPQSPPLPEDLAQRLAADCGRPVHLAVCEADTAADYADADRTASGILAIVRALGRPPGVYRLADVLLEYHLSRPGRGRTALAALLDPVFDRPELALTLRTYVAQQQDRRATARILGVHRNTVDNRITRAGALIGADVSSPHGYALALAALTARELPR